MEKKEVKHVKNNKKTGINVETIQSIFILNRLG